MERVVSWFSAGVTSAVSAKLAVRDHGHRDLHIVYCDTGGEHESNKRFIFDIGAWIGRPIEILKSEKYTDHFDVFEKTGWIVGPRGARCTIELKKRLREQYQQAGDIHIFGFSVEEIRRARHLERNFPELDISYNLINESLSKPDCAAIVTGAGIELPEMYRLGYGHNNCIGCPKGGMGYWNKIRVDFPDVFERMSALEQKLDVAVNKSYAGTGLRQRVFLKDLDPDAGKHEAPLDIDCSMFCSMVEKSL